MERKDIAQQTVKNMLGAGVITPALAAHQYGILIKLCDYDLIHMMIESRLLCEKELHLTTRKGGENAKTIY